MTRAFKLFISFIILMRISVKYNNLDICYEHLKKKDIRNYLNACKLGLANFSVISSCV